MFNPEIHKPAGASLRRKSFDFSGLHPDQNMSEEMVCEFVCLARSTIREKLDPDSDYFDPSFPRPRDTRGEAKKGRAVRWRAGDIINWNSQLKSCKRPSE